MEIIHALTSFDCATVVTVGSFDGVHHGHRVMIELLVEVAH
ncbi:MAG: riboflavin biosynthesis protein RibF, partial [Alistipes sp.]|nr:riboflavin biosynthesis protein RibF [Alistipes sp.]